MDNDIIDDFLVPNNPSGIRRSKVLNDGRVIEFQSVTDSVGLAHQMMSNGQVLPDGRYTLNDDITRFEVLDGFVTHEYYVERFKQRDFDILVDCSRINGYGVGCLIYTNTKPLPDGVYKLKSFKWVKVEDGVIVQTGMFKIST